ncbi:hypothetical protein MMC21_004159 [Puttea exsequens]|nr:hypothetical protein [Puttea exsequens]
MALLSGEYDSSGDERPLPVVAAPDIQYDPAATNILSQSTALVAHPSESYLYSNLPQGVQGPTNPFKSAHGNGAKRKNVLTGFAEEAVISDATFSNQHRTFQSRGYALEPNANGNVVGDLVAATKYGGRDIVQERSNHERRKRQKKGDSSIVEGEGRYLGPWARYEDDVQYEDEPAMEDEELASDEEYIEEEAVPQNLGPVNKASTDYQEDRTDQETTNFLGSLLVDYQGRTYMHAPRDINIDLYKEQGTQTNYIPEKLIHTWSHGNKGITAIRFFPSTSHLLLSASDDSKIKIFDVYRDREVLRSYEGHRLSVSDISFSTDGAHFVSASLDRHVKLWDTETGQCAWDGHKTRYKLPGLPHVIRFSPSSPHEFLVGMSDKRIEQYDTRTGEMVQEYDHHEGAINTITFIEDGQRFMSSSVDRDLRAWEWNINVPIKTIKEPHMFSLVAACPHPSGKSVAFQSGDNQILVYASTDRFRQNRKKLFKGHNTSGNRVDVDISPDGQFLASGDNGGFVCFWDWKTCKMYQKFQAGGKGNQPVTCVQWDRQASSRVATAGAEGVIRLWGGKKDK